MCGLTGFLDPPNCRGSPEPRHQVARMTKSLEHRVADDQATRVDPHAGVVLGSRSLTVIDLSTPTTLPGTRSARYQASLLRLWERQPHLRF